MIPSKNVVWFAAGIVLTVVGLLAVRMWTERAWAQQVMPTFATVPSPIAAGTTFQSPSLVNPTVSGVLSGAQALTTTPGIPFTQPGDMVLAKTLGTSLGPGPGALTLRVRPSPTVPGACMLVAVAGTSSTEVTIKDPIGQGC